jgi:hypothetical protein
LALVPLDWLSGQKTICLFKNIFGFDCIGCGITKAVISAVQLDFNRAYDYNKFIVVVLPLLIFVWLKRVLLIFGEQFQSKS